MEQEDATILLNAATEGDEAAADRLPPPETYDRRRAIGNGVRKPACCGDATPNPREAPALVRVVPPSRHPDSREWHKRVMSRTPPGPWRRQGRVRTGCSRAEGTTAAARAGDVNRVRTRDPAWR